MISGTINVESSSKRSKGKIDWTCETTSEYANVTIKFYTAYTPYKDVATSLAGSYSLKTRAGYKYVNNASVSVSKFLSYGTDGAWTLVFEKTHSIPTVNGRVQPFYIDFEVSETGLESDKIWYDTPHNAIDATYIEPQLYIYNPKVLSSSNFNDEENVSFTYENRNGDLVSSLQACITNSTSSVILVPYRDIPKDDTSYTYNFTSTERAALRANCTGKTAEVRLHIRAIIDGKTRSHYLTKVFSVINAQPTITAQAIDSNSITTALTGNANKIIKGYSTLSFNMVATPKKESTISSYYVACGNRESNSNSGSFTKVENNVISFMATDSRGYSTIRTITLDAIDYIKPTCNQKVTLVANQEGSNGAQIYLEMYGNYFDGNFGAKNNTLKLEVRHSQNNGEMGEWTDLTPLLADVGNNTYRLTTNISGFDVSGSYTFQCRATDALASATTEEYTVTFTPVFDWSATDFNFNVPVTIEGNPIADYVIETGTEKMGSNGTWYWSKWKSGKAECYGCRNYGNMAINQEFVDFYKSETFVQDLPFGLFEYAPDFINIYIRNLKVDSAWIVTETGVEASAGSTGAFFVARPSVDTLQQVYISFNAIGRWK